MQNRNALAVLGRSGNLVFRGNAFAPDATFAVAPAAQRMTLGGTVNNPGILLTFLLILLGKIDIKNAELTKVVTQGNMPVVKC